MKLNYTDMAGTCGGQWPLGKNVITDLEDNTEVVCIPSSKVSKTELLLVGLLFWLFGMWAPPSSQINHTQSLILSYKSPALA